MKNYLKPHAGREMTRYAVRKRDNFTCQDCGLKRTPEEVFNYNKNIKGLSGRLKSFDVHHINGLCGKKSRGYDSIKDMSGLITLCHKCHYNRPEHRVKQDGFGQSVRDGWEKSTLKKRGIKSSGDKCLKCEMFLTSKYHMENPCDLTT